MATRVLVVDDHTLVRQGIVRLLSSDKQIEVVGEAANGFEALERTKELKPDVVLMDLYMPGLDGVSVTRLIKRELPNVQVVLITASPEEADIVEAVQAGARGYIPKTTDGITLIKQLKQAVSGGVALSEDMTSKLVQALSHKTTGHNTNGSNSFALLTQREKETLALISQGKTNKEIADALVVSVNTVRAHVRSLMQKMNLDNRTQLAVHGLREGFGLEGTDSRSTPAAAGMRRPRMVIRRSMAPVEPEPAKITACSDLSPPTQRRTMSRASSRNRVVWRPVPDVSVCVLA